MFKLDLKDRKILYQLEKNSRQSYSQIAKQVGVSKNSVMFRIKELEKKEIIKGYYTYIDNYRLGYLSIRVHFTFQNMTPRIEEKILNFFIENQYTQLVARAHGLFDLSVIFMLKDIHDFYTTWQDINERFGSYFLDKRFSFYVKEYHFRPSYLLSTQQIQTSNREYDSCGGGVKTEIDQIDHEILMLLAKNARISLTTMSNILSISTQTISYRIKNLMKNQVIVRFGVLIDLSKIGYQSFKAYIHLKDHSVKQKIINDVMMNPHLSYIDFTTGNSDLELDFRFKNDSEFFHTIDSISERFPNAIMYYSYGSIPRIFKEQFMPVL